jgi:hypothetical protein
MDWRHYGFMVLLVIGGYWLGTKYPGWLTKGTGGIVTG